MKVDNLGNFLAAGMASSSVSEAYSKDAYDTKVIRRLGMEIKGIERETEYIKQYGEKPNITPISYDYKKLLDIT